jgi:hypothetical protein
MTAEKIADPDLVIDVLADLQHDLGKYLRLPLAWLPADADAYAEQEAADSELVAPHRGPAGTRTAAEFWAACCDEIPTFINSPVAAPLRACVDRALGWVERLGPDLDRAALTADLNAVGPVITDLIAALEA